MVVKGSRHGGGRQGVHVGDRIRADMVSLIAAAEAAAAVAAQGRPVLPGLRDSVARASMREPSVCYMWLDLLYTASQ